MKRTILERETLGNGNFEKEKSEKANPGKEETGKNTFGKYRSERIK